MPGNCPDNAQRYGWIGRALHWPVVLVPGALQVSAAADIVEPRGQFGHCLYGLMTFSHRHRGQDILRRMPGK